MKRLSQLLSLLLCLAMLCSCAVGTPNEPTTEAEHSSPPVQVSESHADGEKYFMLEKLPDIGTYTDKNEVYGRWYKEHTDRLIPRKDYGELVPFLGSIKEFEITQADFIMPGDIPRTVCKYGLATTDGRIVVDAVFDFINYYKLDNGKSIIFMSSHINGGQMEGGIDKGFVAASDGSWIIGADNSFVSSTTEGMIVVVRHESYSFVGASAHSSVYDYSGKLLFEKEGSVERFSEGLAAVTIETYGSNGEYYSTGEYIDKKGKTVIPLNGGDSYYCSLGEFKNGIADISIKGKFGIMGKDGNWINEPAYNNCWRLNNDLFYVNDGENSLILNNEGKVVKSLPKGVESNQVSRCDVDGCDCNGAWYVHDGAVKDLFTDIRVVCKENGLPATGTLRGGNCGYFSCVDSNGVKYLFDHRGNTLYKGKADDEYFGFNGNIIEVFHNKGTEEQYNVGDFYLVNRKTGEVIETKTRAGDDDDWYQFTDSFQNFADRIIVCLDGNCFYYNKGMGKCRIMDAETGEYLSDEFEHIDIVETGAGIYYHATKGNFITLFDKDFNVVMRFFREKTD